MENINNINLNLLASLKHSWTAEVKLNNNQQITIWYTAFPMMQDSISKVVSVSSDYPKSVIRPMN